MIAPNDPDKTFGIAVPDSEVQRIKNNVFIVRTCESVYPIYYRAGKVVDCMLVVNRVAVAGYVAKIQYGCVIL